MREDHAITKPASYTVAEIASALGMKRQAVQWHLRSIQACETRLLNGIECGAWRWSAFPQQLRSRLEAAAAQRGCRNGETLLTTPPAAWPPKDYPALHLVADSEIDRAGKLRQALMPSLVAQHVCEIPAAEFEARGVAEFARVFGRTITARHWRSLFKRTLERDAGAENFGRVELYLPDRPAVKARMIESSIVADFAEIRDCISAFRDPGAPSEIEQRAVWTLAFENYGRLIAQGMLSKRAARLLRNFLFAKAAFLAPSRDALLKGFNRKLQLWTESKCDAKALQDRRAGNGERFDFPEADKDLLIHRAVFYYLGDIAPAWRSCLRDGFSEATRQRYAGNASDKSHVPDKVMDLVQAEVEILTVIHRGPRAFDSIKGFGSRNYDGIASLQCIQGDDFTLNTYFYVPDGKGWFNLTRGQVILFICFRTLRILGWALEPRKSYSSLTIRSLCTHIFGEFGVPEILYFERGIWKSSDLLKGKRDPFSFVEISQGLREFGVKFIHAKRARSKTIERVGGLFQDIAEAEPGYCGRDERRDAPESLRKQMAEVETRKAHPSEYFYSLDQWNRRIGDLVREYNSSPQQGKILAGLSPDAGFEQHMDHTNPPMQFGPQLRYLLAHDRRRVHVTLNGITIQIGKRKFNYKGREIAHLVGRDALAWFDPENSELLTVTDLDRRNPICVSLCQEPGALDVVLHPDSMVTAQEQRRIEDQASHMKTRFNVIKAKFPLPARKALADAQTIELGKEIEQQREIRTDHQNTLNRVRRKAGASGAAIPQQPKRIERVQDGMDWEAEIRRSLNSSGVTEGSGL